MNTLNRRLVMIAAALAIVVTTASAQTVTLKVSVPFQFAAGSTVLPAGDYRIPVNIAGPLVVSGDRTSRFISGLPTVTKADDRPRLVFVCRAERCALREIRTGGMNGYEFPAPKWSKSDSQELARVVVVSARLSNAD